MTLADNITKLPAGLDTPNGMFPHGELSLHSNTIPAGFLASNISMPVSLSRIFSLEVSLITLQIKLWRLLLLNGILKL